MTSHKHANEAYGEIKLFAGTASPELANKIADYLSKDFHMGYYT